MSLNWSAELVAEVPPAVVTVTSTTPADCGGAVAVIDVAEFTVKPAATDPKATALAPDNSVPEIVTDVPPVMNPLDGLIELTTGRPTR